MTKGFVIVMMFLVLFNGVLFAYDDLKTHPDLTKSAIAISDLEGYLKNFLGIPEGRNRIYSGDSIVELLQDGATNEDLPFRAYNHFWNPIHNEGLDDEGWGNTFGWIPIYWHFTGLGNRDWAMGHTEDGTIFDICGGGDQSHNNDCNDYSWRRARDAFYKALVSLTEEMRNQNFIEFYERLGRVLHLLQDVSVPAHSRNDMFGHLDFAAFEGVNPLGWGGNLYEFWVKLHPGIISVYSRNAIIPFFTKPEQYWDQEVYTGADPDVTLPVNGEERAGLAEYSNANCMSKCTMFTEDLPFGDRHYFPYPKKSSVVDPLTDQTPPEEIIAEDGNTDRVFYVKKIRDGEEIDHFAQARYFWEDLYITLTDVTSYYRLAYTLDDRVHEDYAKKLIPKAVGYTAGLINYFFRGTMEIAPPDQFVCALVDITPTPENPSPAKKFTELKLKLKNTTPNNEEMEGGRLIAVARYYKPIDPTFDPSQQFPLWEDLAAEYSYSVSEEIAIPLPSRDDFTECSFDFTDSPIPTNASDLTIQVVYRGRLGNEDDAIAVGMMDVHEPDYFNVWNITDYFCLDGGLTVSNYENDFDGDGRADEYCSPTEAEVKLSFSKEPYSPCVALVQYDFDLGIIEPGSYKRIVILQDQEEFHVNTMYVFHDADPDDSLEVPRPSEGCEDYVIAMTCTEVQNQFYAELQAGGHDSQGVEFTELNRYRIVTQPQSFRGKWAHHQVKGWYFRYGTIGDCAHEANWPPVQ